MNRGDMGGAQDPPRFEGVETEERTWLISAPPALLLAVRVSPHVGSSANTFIAPPAMRTLAILRIGSGL